MHGVLIPVRSHLRFSRRKGYGVLVAYLHDIGMFDFSVFGRVMHPEFAARAVFSAELQSVLTTIWEENSGNLAWYLTNLATGGLPEQAPLLVLREMLALSIVHSNSKVPISLLDEPGKLRKLMLVLLQMDLHALYTLQQEWKMRSGPAGSALLGKPEPEEWLRRDSEDKENNQMRLHNPDLACHYNDFEGEAFRWLLSAEPLLEVLRQDVFDTLRALRYADALRQRGRLLTTSGGY